MKIAVFTLLISINSIACDIEVCDALCKYDGDKKGIIIDGVCGCWNPSNKISIKVPKNGSALINKKTYSWE